MDQEIENKREEIFLEMARKNFELVQDLSGATKWKDKRNGDIATIFWCRPGENLGDD